MSRPCPTSSQCSGGTMHPDSSLGQPRGRRPPEGTWPSCGDRHGPVLAAQAPLSCPSPCGVQSGFWELPRPLQVFAAQPPCARLASLWTGEGSEARGLFSVAFLAPSISLARGGVAGELGLKQKTCALVLGPGQSQRLALSRVIKCPGLATLAAQLTVSSCHQQPHEVCWAVRAETCHTGERDIGKGQPALRSRPPHSRHHHHQNLVQLDLGAGLSRRAEASEPHCPPQPQRRASLLVPGTTAARSRPVFQVVGALGLGSQFALIF